MFPCFSSRFACLSFSCCLASVVFSLHVVVVLLGVGLDWGLLFCCVVDVLSSVSLSLKRGHDCCSICASLSCSSCLSFRYSSDING